MSSFWKSPSQLWAEKQVNKIFRESWKIECEDGTHEISIEGTNIATNPIKLFVDNEYRGTIEFKRKTLVPKFEHKFTCAGEDVTLIFFAGKYDLVHRGVLQKANVKYDPKAVLPKPYRIFSIALILLSFTLVFLVGLNLTEDDTYFLLLLMLSPLFCAVFCESSATNPFYSKKKKILLSVSSILWTWLLNGLLVWLLHFIHTEL